MPRYMFVSIQLDCAFSDLKTPFKMERNAERASHVYIYDIDSRQAEASSKRIECCDRLLSIFLVC